LSVNIKIASKLGKESQLQFVRQEGLLVAYPIFHNIRREKIMWLLINNFTSKLLACNFVFGFFYLTKGTSIKGVRRKIQS